MVAEILSGKIPLRLLGLLFWFTGLPVLMATDGLPGAMVEEEWAEESFFSSPPEDPFDTYFPVIIGKPNELRHAPFQLQWPQSVSQSLFTARDIGLGGGYLYGIQFRLVFRQAAPDTRIALWVGETLLPDLAADWADASAFHKVFDSILHLPAGEYDLFLPFDMPYQFEGGNLVVHSLREGAVVTDNNLFFSEVKPGVSGTRLGIPDDTAEGVPVVLQEGRSLNERPMVVLFFGWTELKPLLIKSGERDTIPREPATEPLPQDIPLQQTQSNPDGLMITEFIFNETLTKLGSDFYHAFFREWENPSGVEGLSIFVQERPVPGMGALVMVRVEDQIVYQGMLRPNAEVIRQSVEQAVQRTQAYFTNYEMMQEQLESDDMRGSGIF